MLHYIMLHYIMLHYIHLALIDELLGLAYRGCGSIMYITLHTPYSDRRTAGTAVWWLGDCNVIHFIFIFSSSTGELCSQPIRGNDHRIGRMFPEHVERRFLDPEYSFDEYFQLGSRSKVPPVKNQLASPNTSN